MGQRTARSVSECTVGVPQEAVIPVPVGQLIGRDGSEQTVLGAIGLGTHSPDVFKFKSLRNILIRNIPAQQEKGSSVHRKKEYIFPVLAELFHCGKLEVTSPHPVKVLFLRSRRARLGHADLAVLTALVNLLFHGVVPAAGCQQIRLSETKDRAVRGRVCLVCKLVSQPVRPNVLQHHGSGFLHFRSSVVRVNAIRVNILQVNLFQVNIP